MNMRLKEKVIIVNFLDDESGPVTGQTLDVEQHPMFGRNLPKDISSIK